MLEPRLWRNPPFPIPGINTILQRKDAWSRKSTLGMSKFILVSPPLGKPYLYSTTYLYKFCRNPKELPTNGSSHFLSACATQGLLLEPVHKVVGQQYQFKVQPRSSPASRHVSIQAKIIHVLFNEILTAGPLVITMPDFFSRMLAVSGYDLIIIQLFLDIEQLELFSRLLVFLDRLSNNHKTNLFILAKGNQNLPRFPVSCDPVPCSYTKNQPLDPKQLGDHYVKFNLLLAQPCEKIPTEKATVRPKPYGGFIWKLVEHLFNEILHLMVGAIARTKMTPKAVPGLTNKAQNRMVAFPPRFLWVIATLCPMLIAKNRNNMRVEIQGDGFHLLKSIANPAKKHVVDPSKMIRHMNRDLCKKPADSALGRKTIKMGDLLEHLVCGKFHHVARTKDPHHQSIEHGKAHFCRGIVTFPPFACTKDCHCIRDAELIEEPTHQTSSSKAGDILSSETFHLVSVAFWGYTIFHFLSASFFWYFSKYIILERRHFSYRKQHVISIIDLLHHLR